MTPFIPLSTDPAEAEFYAKYFDIDPMNCPNYKYDNKYDKETDIYVITFNNPFFVEYQIKTLQQFFKNPYNLIIVDNNNQLYPETSEQIYQMCVKESATYLKAPDNFYQNPSTFDSSMKLGTTMTWLYKSCISVRKPKYFGFLDHDCFLIRNLDLKPYLNMKGMYGRICKSNISDAWNLHVTVNFFRYDVVKNLLLDFRASHKYQLDTGGSNYDILYKNYSFHDYDIGLKAFRYSKEDVNRKGSVQHYEIIGDCWFHVAASSHDQLAGDGEFKLIYTKGFLDSKLQSEVYFP